MDGFQIIADGCMPVLFGPQGRELRIGRNPDNDLVLDDPAVSRHHARLLRSGGEVLLEDLGSRHGCNVNGRRLERPVPVQPGDRLLIGQVLVRIERAPAEPAPGGLQSDSISVAVPLDALAAPRTWSGADADRWGRLLGILHELSLQMIQACPAERLLTLLLERMLGFFGAGRGSVLLLDARGQLRPLAERSAAAGRGGSDPGQGFHPLPMAEQALQRREALVVETTPVDRRGTKGTTLSMMNIPLEFEGELLGVVCLEEGDTPFTETDLRLAVSLCNLASAKAVLERREAEIRRKTDLERQLQGMVDTTRAKSELLAFVGHEIRNPLAALIAFVDLARGEELPGRAGELVRKIELSAGMLKSLLDDLLDLSKVEFGKMRLEAVPFRVRDLVQGAAHLYGAQAQAKGLRIEVDCDPAVPVACLGDPLRLGQVLTNLVGNAVKFTGEGAVRLSLRLAAREDGRAGLAFAVADTGPGLTAAQRERVFEPFAQAEDSTSRRFGGSGLGLAICRRLVELMGGQLDLDSEPGAGCTFRFTVELPVGEDLADLLPEPRTTALD